MTRAGRRRPWAAAILGIAATLAAAALLPAVSDSAAPAFVLQSTYPYPETLPGSISCVGPTFCMQVAYGYLPGDEAAQAVARSTTDGGTTWHDTGALPKAKVEDIGVFGANVACASKDVCVFVGGDGVVARTTDGGTRWSSLRGGGALIACVASGGCLTVAQRGKATRTYWSSRSSTSFRPAGTVLPGSVQPIALSCAPTSRCFLTATDPHGGVVAVSSNVGPATTWHLRSSSGPTWIQSLSCPTAATCVAMASVPTSPTQFHRIDVLERTTDAAASWTREAPMPGSATDGASDDPGTVSCSSLQVCVSTVIVSPYSSTGPGAALLRTMLTVDGGRAWAPRTVASIPAGLGFPELAASCLAGPHCLVDFGTASILAFAGGTAVTSNGTTWATLPLAASDASGISLACTTADTCYRIDEVTSSTGYASRLLRSADDGSSWTAVPMPAGVEPVRIAGCQGATTCEVFGVSGVSLFDGLEGQFDPTTATTELLTTTDAGTSWVASAVPGSGSFPELASCASPTSCVVVDVRDSALLGPFDTIESTTNATTWSSTPLSTSTFDDEGGLREDNSVFAASYEPSALSCTPAGLCVLGTIHEAKGATLLDVSTDGGTSWHTVATPAGGATVVDGIQCFSTATCDVEYYSDATSILSFTQTTDDGATWQPSTVVSSNLPANSFGADLSCTSVLECTTVVGNEAVLVDESANAGSTWTTEGWDAPQFGAHDFGVVLVAFLSCSPTACLVATQDLVGLSAGSLELVRMAR